MLVTAVGCVDPPTDTHSVEALNVFDMLVDMQLKLFRKLFAFRTAPPRPGNKGHDSDSQVFTAW